jgi:hypothetical protein
MLTTTPPRKGLAWRRALWQPIERRRSRTLTLRRVDGLAATLMARRACDVRADETDVKEGA